MKRLTRKAKLRITVLFSFFLISFVIFIATFFSYASQIYNNKIKENKLTDNYNKKLEEEEELKSEINKLNDPEYMARYTREKFLYSKNDEIIIKIDE